jgi:hypothetical protein
MEGEVYRSRKGEDRGAVRVEKDDGGAEGGIWQMGDERFDGEVLAGKRRVADEIEGEEGTTG